MLAAIPAFGQDQKLDPSCAELNDAFAATRSTAMYSEKLYDIDANGERKLQFEHRFNPDTEYHKRLEAAGWERYPRVNWALADEGGPKYTSCAFIAEEREGGVPVRHYSGTWRQKALQADTDIWFRADDKRFVRVERRFRDVEHAKSAFGLTSGTVLEVFDYDPLASAAPDGPFEDENWISRTWNGIASGLPGGNDDPTEK
ncbi:hypothetical protein GCM10010520_62770 [Rhizobium viscosum]